MCVFKCASIKLGVMEDHSNRTRLAKLLRFYSSNSDTETTSLADYVERMKEKQEHIYFIAGSSRKEVETSPFVERLLKKGYEVRYCQLCFHVFISVENRCFQCVVILPFLQTFCHGSIITNWCSFVY